VGDDRDRGEREKLSWSEIDKRRGQGRTSQNAHPRGHAARQRAERDTRTAIADAEALFAADKGGEEGAVLAAALRDAHGSPDVAAAGKAYLERLGVPDAPELLAILLDTGVRDLVVPALERLLELKQKGRLEVSGGLKTQLRALSQAPDDDVAGLSEDLLA